MWPNTQFPADLVKFTEEIFNGKIIFLCSVVNLKAVIGLNLTGRFPFNVKLNLTQFKTKCCAETRQLRGKRRKSANTLGERVQITW